MFTNNQLYSKHPSSGIMLVSQAKYPSHIHRLKRASQARATPFYLAARLPCGARRPPLDTLNASIMQKIAGCRWKKKANTQVSAHIPPPTLSLPPSNLVPALCRCARLCARLCISSHTLLPLTDLKTPKDVHLAGCQLEPTTEQR